MELRLHIHTAGRPFTLGLFFNRRRVGRHASSRVNPSDRWQWMALGNPQWSHQLHSLQRLVLLAVWGDTPSPKSSVEKPFILSEGLPPVPHQLAARILRGEYVDMAELLRDNLEAQRRAGAASSSTDKVTFSRMRTFAVM